jgi:hypothetical protein
MAEPTPADELRQAAATLRDTRNSIDVLLKARELLAVLLDEQAQLTDRNEYRSPRHRYDTSKALAAARQINASGEGA